jgi:hypothetical protein
LQSVLPPDGLFNVIEDPRDAAGAASDSWFERTRPRS